jgi:thioredoxin reductase (NADPH)
MDFNLSGMSMGNQSKEEKHVKVLILGSGPAGFSAALYTARGNLDPVVLTGIEFGGQVSLTYTVENYPGFPEGVGGQQLVELFQKQAEKFGASVEYDTAISVDLSYRPFKITTENVIYEAETLIIATGATPLHLEVPGEVKLTGRGVSYCATCDGWFFKEKEVIVVGGGDSALEESLFLTRYAKSITLVHRRDELRAGAILQKRAKAEPKIKFAWNTVISEIVGTDKVEAVLLKDVVSGKIREQKTDGVFIFIGHRPNTQLFLGQIELDDHGYLKTNVLMQTNVPGVFVAGEAGDPNYRQVITSAGMGAAAAMQALRFLEAQNEG